MRLPPEPTTRDSDADCADPARINGKNLVSTRSGAAGVRRKRYTVDLEVMNSFLSIPNGVPPPDPAVGTIYLAQDDDEVELNEIRTRLTQQLKQDYTER